MMIILQMTILNELKDAMAKIWAYKERAFDRHMTNLIIFMSERLLW